MYYDELIAGLAKKGGGDKAGQFIFDKGILRERAIYSQEQQQTEKSFGYKWSKKDSYNSFQVEEANRKWLLEKYFDNDIKKRDAVFKSGYKVLDAGCGAGFSAFLLLGNRINDIKYLGIDISDAVDVAKKDFEERGLSGNFIQCNLSSVPMEEKSFDVIFSEGVLHHTDSTEMSLKKLSFLLKEGGFFLFYVYTKKAPVREFVDDYIRNYFADKNDEDTWNEMYALTKLGKILGDLNVDIEVEDAIPFLGISAGKINLQRFFYWYICKAYYRPEYMLEEMNHVNFDWYRPKNCYRQTPEEVKRWCKECGLKIERMYVEEAGMSVIARKQG